MSTPSIAIAGAGLAGSLLAVTLGRRGWAVTVYEKRPDPRQAGFAGGRSINLALSDRGLLALERAGVRQAVQPLTLPVHHRQIHALDGGTANFRYSAEAGRHINSVSRGGLNQALIQAASTLPNVRLVFDHAVEAVDLAAGTLTLAQANGQRTTSPSYDAVLAADGAGSAVRQALAKAVPGFQETVDELSHGYKEVAMPPTASGAHAMDAQALHIWPRGAFMLMALPNPDGSFTCTLFAPYEGPTGFNALTTAEAVEAYFQTHFPDVPALVPDLADQFLANPTGKLATLRCHPWTDGQRAVVLGDAAHAIVPFYGQGMNAAFEDVRVLDDLLTEHGPDWPTVLPAFQALRKPNADAIADLALENFVEMRDHSGNPLFQRKRQLELALERTYPQAYASKYSLVTFRPDIPYHQARAQGNAQDAALMALAQDLPAGITSQSLGQQTLAQALEAANQAGQAALQD